MTKIFLDTKYWIYFGDVILDSSNNDSLKASFTQLAMLCDSGKVVCPICEEVFYEVTKQTDPTTLAATISLIDYLSKGTSLISFEERIKVEILNFFYNSQPHKYDIHPLHTLVWTKICHTLGFRHLYATPLNSEEELVIQKAFFDQMWSSKLGEICELFGYSKINSIPKMPDLSDLMNLDVKELR